jgi:twinkle protein
MQQSQLSKAVIITEQHVPCGVCDSSDGRCNYSDGHGFCFSCKHYFPPDQIGGNMIGASATSWETISFRGLTKEALTFYGIKTKVASDGRPLSTYYPYDTGGYKVRMWDKKEFFSEGPQPEKLFGEERFNVSSHKYVTITEGYEDAVALYQVLKSPVVSIHTSATALRDCKRSFDYLNSFDRIYIAFDNDSPGRDAANDVVKLFDINKIHHVKFTKYKDANDYLIHNEGEQLKHIWWNSKKYIPENVVSSLASFKTILEEQPTTSISYPFPSWTKMTHGIRPGEIVLITGQEGIGKTEVMHTILHHVLKEDPDANASAIFLEEPKKRLLQAIAGIEDKTPYHLPTNEDNNGKVLETLHKVLGDDDRLFIYSHFGSDDPDVLLSTIRLLVAGYKCKYVFLDHLTMAVAGRQGEDERLALDYLSANLNAMVNELFFSLIMVSHVNEKGKTRGSTYPAKVAHVRIDLDRDLLSTSDITRMTLRSSISKNRPASFTGAAGELLFDPATYTLSQFERT